MDSFNNKTPKKNHNSDEIEYTSDSDEDSYPTNEKRAKIYQALFDEATSGLNCRIPVTKTDDPVACLRLFLNLLPIDMPYEVRKKMAEVILPESICNTNTNDGNEAQATASENVAVAEENTANKNIGIENIESETIAIDNMINNIKIEPAEVYDFCNFMQNNLNKEIIQDNLKNEVVMKDDDEGIGEISAPIDPEIMEVMDEENM